MKRKLVSLTIFSTFIILSITGILMYIKPFDISTGIIHIIAGFLFLIVALFHIINNYTPLFKYFKTRKDSRFNLSRTFIAILLIAFVSWLAVMFGLPPFNSVLPLAKKLRGDTEVFYQKIETNAELNGMEIKVEVLQLNPKKTPTTAIWVEDKDGNYLHDLYVSQKIATESFMGNSFKRRPEALPVWSHKRGIKANDGFYTPEKETPLTDGTTGATPNANYILQTQLSPEHDSVRILLEVNQSFDWNEYYHKNAFPTDSIYSGPGSVGQPALIYSTDLLDLKRNSISKMSLIGRAHHSGKDGNLYSDLSNITTAREIIDRIIVEVE